MKTFWPTVILLAVMVSLGAYVYLVELPGERAKTASEVKEKKLVPFEESAITAFTVKSPGGEVTLTRTQPRVWAVTSPVQTEADLREVESLIRALVLGKVTRVVEEKAATLGPFGLESPPAVIALTAGSQTETLSLGDSGPLSSTLYAMRESDRQVLLTDLAAKDVFNKTLLTFRRKEVLGFDRERVVRIHLLTPKSEVTLERKDNKEKSPWSLIFPVETRADQGEARLLLSQLEDLKAMGFIDPGPEHQSISATLTRPVAKIIVEDAAGERTVRLFQPDPASGEAFAVTTPEGPIARINPGFVKDISKDLFAFLDKRLLGAEMDDISMLKIKTREEQYMLAKRSGLWLIEDAPTARLDQQKASLFVSRVVDLPAELRVVKAGGPLAPYGLHAPTAEFTAIGTDGKERGRIRLGNKVGGLVYAVGHGLGGVYQARADILNLVPPRKELIVADRPQASAPSP